MRNIKRKVALLLAIILLATNFTGCSNNSTGIDTINAEFYDAVATETPSIPELDTSAVFEQEDDENISEAVPPQAITLSDKQRNSINMLNYLVAFSREVNSSKNNRLFLEEAYTSLYNNTNPNAIDARTQAEINTLFKKIDEYRMVAVKRDRLQFIFEQDKAQAIRDAMPNPVGILSAVQSFNLAKLVGYVGYVAANSISNYQSSSAQDEMKFLQANWELDEVQDKAFSDMRISTFNYMVETVRDYELSGSLALTEETVSDFITWKQYTNTLQKIQLFEANVETYRAFGPYWLTLAKCYYDNQDYAKCIEALDQYEALNLQIFRHDFEYANALPYAIVAAEESMSDEEYVHRADKYAASILANTTNSDWALRYFASQTYIKLFGITENHAYLKKAYDIALNNVCVLLSEQLKLNAEYIEDVKVASVPQGLTETQKKDIEQYNSALIEDRKTALPPVYEPLKLNCDLLLALSEELNTSSQERQRVDAILHENNAPLFLDKCLDRAYWFNAQTTNFERTQQVGLSKTELTIPVEYVSANSVITVTIKQDETVTVINDWSVVRVDRKDKYDISSFVATYISEEIKSFPFKSNATIEIDIAPDLSSDAAVSVQYTTKPIKVWVFFDDIEFVKAEE